MAEVLGRYSKLDRVAGQIRTIRWALAKSEPRRRQSAREPHVHALSRRLPADSLDAMVAAYHAGEPAERIAPRYGVAPNPVLRLLHERGIQVRIGKLCPADIDEMVRLYQAGLTQRVVGERFGVSRSAVRLVLLGRGIELRRRTQ